MSYFLCDSANSGRYSESTALPMAAECRRAGGLKGREERGWEMIGEGGATAELAVASLTRTIRRREVQGRGGEGERRNGARHDPERGGGGVARGQRALGRDREAVR